MDPLGLIISWLPVLVGEPVLLLTIQTEEVNLMELLGVFPSHGVDLSVTCWLTSAGVRKSCAALYVVSVTISIRRIVRRTYKVSPLPVASSTIVCSIIGMTTGMISGMIWLIDNWCGEFLLVVSISVTLFYFIASVSSYLWIAVWIN